jgi:hypothetical protein
MAQGKIASTIAGNCPALASGSARREISLGI